MPSPTPQITYCGNVHAGTDLDAWLSLTERFALPVRAARRAAGHAFGLGTWWNASTVRRLAEDPAALDRVRAFLEEHDLPLWTLNVFPAAAFHGAPVKTAVYQPDWATEERLLYTRHAAEAAARLARAGAIIPLSTLPLGFGTGDRRLMARNLVRAASHLRGLRDDFGVHLILALEPEPFCLLETVAETTAFLEEWVFHPDAWTVPESVLREHLGVCIDLCHLEVVAEDPLAAIADLGRRGILCPKIQISSCLELRDPSGLDALLAFDEPVYLHQTIAEDGSRALDLAEVRRRRSEFERAGRLRTHFHLPVFWDQDGALGSTRAGLERFLAGLPRPTPLLEVETYTWGVLPDFGQTPADLEAGLDRELDFVTTRIEG